VELDARLRYFSQLSYWRNALEFRVIWEIDIHAETPQEAVQQARALQLKPDLPVTIFDIWDHARRKMHRIDLAADSNSLDRAQLTELRADLRMLQCTPAISATIQDIAAVMLIFLDREEKFFRS
jgi:hypothetical protein